MGVPDRPDLTKTTMLEVAIWQKQIVARMARNETFDDKLRIPKEQRKRIFGQYKWKDGRAMLDSSTGVYAWLEHNGWHLYQGENHGMQVFINKDLDLDMWIDTYPSSPDVEIGCKKHNPGLDDDPELEDTGPEGDWAEKIIDVCELQIDSSEPFELELQVPLGHQENVKAAVSHFITEKGFKRCPPDRANGYRMSFRLEFRQFDIYCSHFSTAFSVEYSPDYRKSEGMSCAPPSQTRVSLNVNSFLMPI